MMRLVVFSLELIFELIEVFHAEVVEDVDVAAAAVALRQGLQRQRVSLGLRRDLDLKT
jgi:hypothetical protein